MSALGKLKELMAGLKTVEHDRWDTAAHAVLELEHKFGFGGAPTAPVAEPDPKAAEDVAALKDQVAHLTDQVKVLGEAVDMLLKPAAPAPQPEAVAEPVAQA